jgi:hypothetical protein
MSAPCPPCIPSEGQASHFPFRKGQSKGSGRGGCIRGMEGGAHSEGWDPGLNSHFPGTALHNLPGHRTLSNPRESPKPCWGLDPDLKGPWPVHGQRQRQRQQQEPAVLPWAAQCSGCVETLAHCGPAKGERRVSVPFPPDSGRAPSLSQSSVFSPERWDETSVLTQAAMALTEHCGSDIATTYGFKDSETDQSDTGTELPQRSGRGKLAGKAGCGQSLTGSG